MRDLVIKKIKQKYLKSGLDELSIDLLNFNRKREGVAPFPEYGSKTIYPWKFTEAQLDENLSRATDTELLFMLDSLACQLYR